MKKNALMLFQLYTLDEKHALCTGRNVAERHNFKYRWLPCYKVLFLTERVFGTVCAFDMDEAASKHDSTVLRDSKFLRDADGILDGWMVMADKGYTGSKTSTVQQQ